MKRICFLTDSVFSFGGVQRVTSVIAKALSDDNDVTIVTFDAPAAKDLSMYNLGESPIHFRFFRYPEAGTVETLLCKACSMLYRKVLPKTSLTSRLYALSSFVPSLRKALADELRGGSYDVVIGVQAPLTVRLATIGKRLPGVKTIGWIHNSHEALFSANSAYAGPELRKHFEYQYLRLDRVVMLCRCDRAKYGADVRRHADVIYNPLTLVPGRQSDRRSKRFLAVGRFTPGHKGFDLLLRAFNIFKATESEWSLDIVGEGPEESLYRKYIAEHHMEGRVRIHPFTKDIQKYYSEAAVFVLSSRWEGFGLVLVEAMAHGLPVISSRLPSSLEVMGDYATYFDNGDADALAGCLHDAAQWEDPDIKAAGAQEIVERYKPENITREWQKLIDGL